MLQKTIKNRTIFCRDNIEILRGIDSNTIDLVYLDPPFNKKKNFHAPIGSQSDGASFKDTWEMADIKDEWHGLIAETYPTLYEFLDGVTNIGDKSNKYYLIYMGIRLLEIHRVLKETGAMYLHCDPTMSHYLKLLCDIIFNQKNFRNEIVWCYPNGGKSKNLFAKKHDVILYYTKSNVFTFNGDDIRIPYELISKKSKSPFNLVDKDGRKYRERISNNKIYIYYEDVGKIPNDWWIDIQPLTGRHGRKERTGYPTQKPLPLLERIIKTSSNIDGVILDPFCGCATTCIAAEKLGRKWIGIDVSKMAYHLVNKRMNKEIEGTIDYEVEVDGRVEPIYREDIPERTDTTKNPIKKSEIKHTLFGKQEGKCNGCKNHFEYRHFEIDHVIPKVKGGGDSIENLQLLCGHCNRVKSDNDMPFLISKLKELKVIK